MLFGESLKTLLENYKFRNGRSVVVKDFTLENFETLDVLELLPKGNIYLKRPFRIVELVEVLQPIFERMKSKRENNKVLGSISFIISDRKLIYKDKQAVVLTEKESDIFVSLLNSGNRGITK